MNRDMLLKLLTTVQENIEKENKFICFLIYSKYFESKYFEKENNKMREFDSQLELKKWLISKLNKFNLYFDIPDKKYEQMNLNEIRNELYLTERYENIFIYKGIEL